KVFKLHQFFIVPLFHPAAALRSTGNLEALTASFKKLPAILEKCENYIPESEKSGIDSRAGSKGAGEEIPQSSLF
ncbi:MAG: hypothetical protein AAB928_00220, partial [Patescibacteria group bacterium]